MEQWKKPTKPGFIKLAELSVRAQRLLVADKFTRLRAMIQSHASTLHRTPQGAEALKKTLEQLESAKNCLRGKENV